MSEHYKASSERTDADERALIPAIRRTAPRTASEQCKASYKPSDEKRLVSLQRKLRSLRKRHTELTQAEKWIEAQTSRGKIIALLNQITREFPDWKEQSFALIDRPEETLIPQPQGNKAQHSPCSNPMDIHDKVKRLESVTNQAFALRRERDHYKTHADKLAEALRAWEDAGSEGGISMVDWFEVARKKTREALAAYEAAQ